MRAASLILAAAAAGLLAAGSAVAATIVVDTGHSPRAPGSTASDGTQEFTFNRNLAVAIIKNLRGRGHTVVDVYERGWIRTLQERTTATKRADLFLSVHHDSIQQFLIDEGRASEFSGFSIFVSGLARELRGSLKCAVHVGDAMVEAGENPSLYHAAPIDGENRPLMDDRRGVHRYDHLVVLKSAFSPAILLEAGVLPNPYEVPKLQSADWISRTASHIADGIERCVPGAGVAAPAAAAAVPTKQKR